MCGNYVYLYPLISWTYVFNIVENAGGIMHLDTEPHF